MIVDSEVLKTRLREAFGSDSQETVGKKLNMSQGNISKLLSGSQQPTMDTIYSIAKIYGVSVDWLLGLSNKKSITHYSTETTYASAIKTLLDLKNNGARLAYNEMTRKVAFESNDALLAALMKKALGLKGMDYESYKNWIANKLPLFEDKRLIWDEMWKLRNVYELVREAETETEWLKTYEVAAQEDEKFQDSNEPDVNIFSGG